ncbi:uncharacterized protein [Hoplias malabaricus]|uniref:uncharacterized protein isoform X1 n=1 Tax=Hoplias malabaricus TaxID=27720 RepID=UPI003462CBC3
MSKLSTTENSRKSPVNHMDVGSNRYYLTQLWQKKQVDLEIREVIHRRIQNSIRVALDVESSRRLLSRANERVQMSTLSPLQQRPYLVPSPPLEAPRKSVSSRCMFKIKHVNVDLEKPSPRFDPENFSICNVDAALQGYISTELQDHLRENVRSLTRHKKAVERPTEQGSGFPCAVFGSSSEWDSIEDVSTPEECSAPPYSITPSPDAELRELLTPPRQFQLTQLGSKIPRWTGFDAQKRTVTEFIRKQDVQRIKKLTGMALVCKAAERHAKFLLPELECICQNVRKKENLDSRFLAEPSALRHVPFPAAAEMSRHRLAYEAPGSKIPKYTGHARQRKPEGGQVKPATKRKAVETWRRRQPVRQGASSRVGGLQPAKQQQWRILKANNLP